MMAAMMLPSAMPMILVHHRTVATPARIRSELRSGIFVGAYIAVWAASGIVVWLLARLSDAVLPTYARPYAVAGVLLLAGVYQLTPLKTACLGVCRSPMSFVMTHWHPGLRGEVRLGLEHGLYCLGCCWALMAVFVAAAAMGLMWGGLIVLIVLVERGVPQGGACGRGVGAARVGGAVRVWARPGSGQ